MLPLVLVTLTLAFRQIGVEPGDRQVRNRRDLLDCMIFGGRLSART